MYEFYLLHEQVRGNDIPVHHALNGAPVLRIQDRNKDGSLLADNKWQQMWGARKDGRHQGILQIHDLYNRDFDHPIHARIL